MCVLNVVILINFVGVNIVFNVLVYIFYNVICYGDWFGIFSNFKVWGKFIMISNICILCFVNLR